MKRLLASLFLCATPGFASAQLPNWAEDIGYDQHPGEQLPLDTSFVRSDGTSVELSELFGERPVILAFVYFECPMLCDQVLSGLVRSLRAISFDVGREFDVIALSIDPGETPALAAEQKAGWLKRYGRERTRAGWHFLTGEEANIKRVAGAAGFRYAYDAETDEYAHAAGVVVVTADGTLSRYFFDVEFPARDIRLGLVEASEGKIDRVIDRVLLFCFQYDRALGAYTLATWRVLRFLGALTVGAITLFIGRSLWKERRKPAVATEAPSS